MLHVEGSLILTKPAGDTGLFNLCDGDPEDPFTICELVSDMESSVFLLLALADLTPLAGGGFPLFEPLFAGSALLEWVPVLGEDGEPIPGSSAPNLFRDGDFDGNGTFVMSDGAGGACTADFCRVDVDLSMTFTDVQSLGFGEEFEVGLLLVTDANQFSAPDRSAESNFFNTASVDVTFLPQQIPVPASWLLLVAGLLGMAVARRARRLR